MSALKRLVVLKERLLAMDSGSGEAADLALALAVIEAARSEVARKHPLRKSWEPVISVLAALTKS